MTNFGFQKFISSIMLDRKIHGIQRYDYFSHPHKNWADCQKTDSGGINWKKNELFVSYPMRGRLELTLVVNTALEFLI